jgi:hypothetical protein
MMSGAGLLTLADLDRALEDERHMGYGYAIASDLTPHKRERLNRAVIAVANQLGMNYQQLFEWTNSKYGRHLAGYVEHNELPASQESVRQYLHLNALRVLEAGL